MPLHIGIDLGTSGCRTIAIHSNGEVAGEARLPLPPTQQPKPGHHEQDPEVWWSTTVAVLDRLIPQLPKEPIEHLTIDATSATLLLTDERGRPLTPGLMYNDRRAVGEAREIAAIAPADSGAQGPSSSLAKLLWLQRHHPPAGRASFALHQADWISNRLCNRFGWSDENNALKMGYDPTLHRWPTWVAPLTLPSIQLPQINPPGTPYAPLRDDLLKRWNIDQHDPVQVCAGTTDSTAAAIACGIEKPGDAVTSLGTTLVLKILSDTPIFAPKQGIYSHRLGGLWLVSGASNAGAGVLLDHFTSEEITQLSTQIDPATPTGLDYYPLSAPGERFPTADPTHPPRLTPRPKQPQLFLQGILEGLSRIEQAGYLAMEQAGAPTPTRIFSTGGGAQNHAWTELRKRQLGKPVLIAEITEAAYGAAALPLRFSSHPQSGYFSHN